MLNVCCVRVCQLFFGLMALAMVGVRYKSDKRDQYLQHGGWFVKIALWLLFNVLTFFLPVGMINAYGARALPYFCVKAFHIWNDMQPRACWWRDYMCVAPALGFCTAGSLPKVRPVAMHPDQGKRSP